MLALEYCAVVPKTQQFAVNASCYINYINLFIKTVTTQRFNEITFVSSSSTLLSAVEDLKCIYLMMAS
jgi:hypothetical protein